MSRTHASYRARPHRKRTRVNLSFSPFPETTCTGQGKSPIKFAAKWERPLALSCRSMSTAVPPRRSARSHRGDAPARFIATRSPRRRLSPTISALGALSRKAISRKALARKDCAPTEKFVRSRHAPAVGVRRPTTHTWERPFPKKGTRCLVLLRNQDAAVARALSWNVKAAPLSGLVCHRRTKAAPSGWTHVELRPITPNP